MKPSLIALLVLVFSGCAIAPRDQSPAIARALIGQWEYEDGDADCRRHSNEAFRANGTYTSTSSSCDLVSDGFGHFHYGWYVAREHVCFVEVEEQHKDTAKRPAYYRARFLEMMKDGFVVDRCHWRVERVTAREIKVSRVGREPVVLKRKRWM